MTAPTHDDLIAILGADRQFNALDLSVLEFAALPEGVEFEFRDCEINNSRISSNALQGSIWRNCKFRSAEFVGLNLWEAVIEKSMFSTRNIRQVVFSVFVIFGTSPFAIAN
jgi:uncharacterized protein YjbI with pentapeptide repeats